MGPQDIPNPLVFVIKKDGMRLSDYDLDRLNLTYFEGNTKKYVNDLVRGSEDFDSLGVMLTREIGFISADKQIKDFYFEYPGGDIDTLFADFRNVGSKEASGNDCYCRTPLEALKFNGKKSALDSSITLRTVYLFQKP